MKPLQILWLALALFPIATAASPPIQVADAWVSAHPGGLDIPSITTVELKPGGYHMMMMDLTRTILPGQTVPLELRFTDAKGMQHTVSVNARTRFKDPYSK